MGFFSPFLWTEVSSADAGFVSGPVGMTADSAMRSASVFDADADVPFLPEESSRFFLLRGPATVSSAPFPMEVYRCAVPAGVGCF